MNPLLIPEVLEQVFSYLYPETLKECRLVCKAWDLRAPFSPNWTKYYVIHYEKSEKDNQLLIEEERIPRSDGTICRKVLLRPKSYRDESNYVPVSDFDFLRKTIALAVEADQGFAPKLLEVLNQLKNTLIQLSIKETGNGPSWGYLNEDGLPEMPIFPSLKKLSFSVSQCYFFRDRFPLQNLFQKVVSNSPGLKEVDIRDNIFPNFETCGKLRSLIFHGQAYDLGHDREMDVVPVANKRFSIPEFNRVLEQVKDIIETLELGDVSIDSAGIPAIAHSLTLPKFEKVKTLSVAVDLYLQNLSFSLNQLFPRLRNLTLFGRLIGSFALDNWAELEDNETVIGTLNNLEIQGNLRLETMQIISRKFPNLKKLTCYSGVPFHFERDENSKSFLDICLRSIFFDWSLEYAKFGVKSHGCLLTLLSAVKSLTGNLSGSRLSRLEIEFLPGSCAHKVDEEQLNMTDEELVKNFLLLKDTAILIAGVSECVKLPGFMDFAHENGLKILVKPNAAGSEN